MTELVENKKNLVPYDTGTVYEGDFDTILEFIQEVLRALRDEKIEFWKRIFQKYKEDKEGYDLEFRTKETRCKKDLDQFSKIDIKKYYR